MDPQRRRRRWQRRYHEGCAGRSDARLGQLSGSLAQARDVSRGNLRDAGIPKSFDCAMRKAAYEYGKTLLPRHESFPSLYYALNLNSPDCHVPLSGGKPVKKASPSPLLETAIYVAPAATHRHNTDNDRSAEDGSLAAPFTCIQRAADVAAAPAP